MITIQVDSKIYKIFEPEVYSITIKELINTWIESGALEEVKENKEIENLQEKLDKREDDKCIMSK